jgi:YegS/Rv2252/BmrU family lipid kinase
LIDAAGEGGARRGTLLQPPQKICLIYNPVAGAGKSKRIFPQVIKALEEKDIDFDVLTTKEPGDAERIAREAPRDEYRALVSLGGDGTLNEVINGILTSEKGLIPFSVIPAGTGDGFVRGNHIFPHWSEAVEALEKQVSREIDVMRVTDEDGFTRWAVSSIGIGIDAYVAQRVLELQAKKFGKLGYAIEFVRGLFSFDPFDMHLVADGIHTDAEEVWICISMNSEELGGGLIFYPGASAYDGVLNFGYLSHGSRLYLLRAVLHVFRGTHVGMPGIYMGEARTLSIHPSWDVPMHLDGELVEAKFPITIEILPESLELIS